jgi:PTH1 family peptidyl-tRNA hydrolase
LEFRISIFDCAEVAEDAPRIRLIAGLGNPGAEYNGTRHNLGFEVVDRLAAAWGLAWQHSKSWHALWAKAETAILIKPSSHMNRSGEPLQAVAHFYKIAPAEMLVVLDDMALPLGRLRLRPDGGTAGHNGLESIIVQFGTEEIPRLRIGIGAPPPDGSVDYVLGRFFEEERPAVEKAVVRAADAVKCAIDNGLLSAMNQFNKNPESEP